MFHFVFSLSAIEMTKLLSCVKVPFLMCEMICDPFEVETRDGLAVVCLWVRVFVEIRKEIAVECHVVSACTR